MTGLTATGVMTAALEQAAAGDEAAFGRIVAAYHADMVRVAFGICGESEAALDAVQSAWLIAWRKLRSVREPEHLRGWLVAIAANEARHIVRRHHTVRVLEIELDPGDGTDPPDDIRRLDLVNALGHLSGDERRLVALRFGAGLSSSEIGSLLGISASGVRARLAHTMARLRKELGDG